MAESVDALVSNTSGAIHPGSTPGLGTKQKAKLFIIKHLAFSYFINVPKLFPTILYNY